jgi:hypothetical protein
MTAFDLTAAAAAYGELGIPAEPRDGGLWIVNPAAPRFGVRVTARDGEVVWTLVIPRPVAAAEAPEVEAALARINPVAGPGTWALDPIEQTVRYTHVEPAAELELDEMGLLPPLIAVIEQGNTYVHALLEIIDGRERADYVATAS